MYIWKKKLARWCFYCNRGGCFLARLGSRLLYLLVFLPDTGTEQPKSSSRAAAGRVRARQTRREAVDPCCGLFPTHGCSAPHCCTHLSARRRSPGVSPEEVWDIWLCTCLGKTQRWVIPHPGSPETEQGDNHEVPSIPPAPRAGIWGIHRFWGYGHLGLMEARLKSPCPREPQQKFFCSNTGLSDC